MNKILAAATVVSALAIGAPAFAQHIDGSVGYTSVDGGDATVGGVTGRLSWLANDYLGAEGEASFGVKDDTVTVGTTDVNVKLKSQVGIYGVAGVPFGEGNRIYARAGWGSTKIEGKSGTVTVGDSESSFNYGVGAQFLFDGKNGIRADYTKYNFSGSGTDDADTWSISYVRRFQ